MAIWANMFTCSIRMRPPLVGEGLTLRPAQCIFSMGIACTKYSRLSRDMWHSGFFFCDISSSLFFRSSNNFGNQTNSHEQFKGLSIEQRSFRLVLYVTRATTRLASDVNYAQGIDDRFHGILGNTLQLVVLHIQCLQWVEILEQGAGQDFDAAIEQSS